MGRNDLKVRFDSRVTPRAEIYRERDAQGVELAPWAGAIPTVAQSVRRAWNPLELALGLAVGLVPAEAPEGRVVGDWQVLETLGRRLAAS